MICKWCGAEINRAENRCNRCGRENSPLSDCGGFYDLVPQLAPAGLKAQNKKGNSGMALAVALLSLFLVASLALNAMLLVKNGELKQTAQEGTYAAGQTSEKESAPKSFAPQRDPVETDVLKKEEAESATDSTLETLDETAEEEDSTVSTEETKNLE